jgi:hypothetical protein
MGNFFNSYRKALPAHGLLKDAEPPERLGPAPTRSEVAKAVRKDYFANLERLIREDPEAMADLRGIVAKLPPVKPGPSAKLTNTQAFMLVELRRMDGDTHREACEMVAAKYGLTPESIKTKHFEGRKEFKKRRNNAG